MDPSKKDVSGKARVTVWGSKCQKLPWQPAHWRGPSLITKTRGKVLAVSWWRHSWCYRIMRSLPGRETGRRVLCKGDRMSMAGMWKIAWDLQKNSHGTAQSSTEGQDSWSADVWETGWNRPSIFWFKSFLLERTRCLHGLNEFQSSDPQSPHKSWVGVVTFLKSQQRKRKGSPG